MTARVVLARGSRARWLARRRNSWQDWQDGAVPDHIAVQVLIQLEVTGLTEACVQRRAA